MEEAVRATQQSLDLIAPLVKMRPPLATLEQVGQRMAALAMYYQWLGWHADAQKMGTMGAQLRLWPEPLQRPIGRTERSLVPGRPWHQPGDYAGVPELAAILETPDTVAALASEFAELAAAGLLMRQNECLHTPATGWSIFPVGARTRTRARRKSKKKK